MNENFAQKLQNSLTLAPNQNTESRKRSSTFKSDETQPKRTKETSRVNIYTVPSVALDKDDDEDDKILIIHIPQQKIKEDSSSPTKQKSTHLTNGKANSFVCLQLSKILLELFMMAQLKCIM